MIDQTIMSKDEARRELERLNKECVFLTPRVHQALDIAIESIEREENIEESIIQLRAFDLTLKDLKEVGSIDENIFNTFSKIIKQIIERLEPYEIKE